MQPSSLIANRKQLSDDEKPDEHTWIPPRHPDVRVQAHSLI